MCGGECGGGETERRKRREGSERNVDKKERMDGIGRGEKTYKSLRQKKREKEKKEKRKERKNNGKIAHQF